MKFEEFLIMQQNTTHDHHFNLEEQVEKLQDDLDAELKLNEVLQCALQGPVHSCPRFSESLPSNVQVLLDEIAMVEEEIIWLERKVDELKLSLYQEKDQNKEWDLMKVTRRRRSRKKLPYLPPPLPPANETEEDFELQTDGNCTTTSQRRSSFESRRQLSMKSFEATEEIAETSRSMSRRINRNLSYLDMQTTTEAANELSEELVKCLIGIFLKLNHKPTPSAPNKAGSLAIFRKQQPLAFMNSSKSFMSRATVNCKIPPFSFGNSSNIDPYGVLPDFDGPIRDVGPYKTFIQITRGSLDISRASEFYQKKGKLRGLLHRLSNVDLNTLSYKQKLAFWINIYNACIMNVFLQHGLPSTQEKLLALMNKAAMNVGGVVLNALAIEHFILRHPSDTHSNKATTDDKEMLLRQSFGLGYPEPNVTFALCRGSWSSPALRVYTAKDIVNELGRARMDYLEASVGVTSKKKIVVPKLLQWHMTDFADDLESLLEWIYSQLPQSGSLKRLVMECLIGDSKLPLEKLVEIQAYDSEFRYLLPL